MGILEGAIHMSQTSLRQICADEPATTISEKRSEWEGWQWVRKSQEANVSEKEKYEAKKEGTKKKGRKKDNWEGLRWVKKGPHEKAHVERECKKEASIQANQDPRAIKSPPCAQNGPEPDLENPPAATPACVPAQMPQAEPAYPTGLEGNAPNIPTWENPEIVQPEGPDGRTGW